jgi:hypothetical protein
MLGVAPLPGSEPNDALLRLFLAAGDDQTRAYLVSLLDPGEWRAALDLFELASCSERDVRLQAAHRIGAFREPEVLAFVDAWLASESDAEVRAALGEAREELTEVPPWSPERALGPPDANLAADDDNAWAAARAEMGEQWLQLGFELAQEVSALRIFEGSVAGGVTRVSALDVRGNRHELWAGLDPTETPGIFELEFSPTSYRVKSIRITLDTDRRPGWEEIDAVELVGPGGRQWASTAAASSFYGE